MKGICGIIKAEWATQSWKDDILEEENLRRLLLKKIVYQGETLLFSRVIRENMVISYITKWL